MIQTFINNNNMTLLRAKHTSKMPFLPFWILLASLSGGEGAHFAKPFGVRLMCSRGGSLQDNDSGGGAVDQQQQQQQQNVVSICSVQGGRSYMEDEFFVSRTKDFAAVFDGHGGSAVSRYLRQNLYANLQASLPPPPNLTTTPLPTDEQKENTKEQEKEQDKDESEHPTTVAKVPTTDDFEQALRTALEKVDREVQRISHWSFQGSTAVMVWIHATPLYKNRTAVVANVGDSRAVLCRNGTALELTEDHKPNNALERARIEARGGKVVWCGLSDDEGKPVQHSGVYRVNGNLALSRAVGDRSERPAVTAEPDTRCVPLLDKDNYIVLASDGVWDVMSSKDVIRFIQNKLRKGTLLTTCSALTFPPTSLSTLSLFSSGANAHKDIKTLQQGMANFVVDEALRRGTVDNVSVVIVWLHPSP